MRVISRKALREHWEKRAESEQALKAWFKEAEEAIWRTPNEVKQQYGSASIVGNDRVVFNICGNKYRLVVAINYAFSVVYVRFVGTHEEYDAIDAETI